MKKHVSIVTIVSLALAMQIPGLTEAQASQTLELAGGSWTIASTSQEAKVSWEFPEDLARVSLYSHDEVVASSQSNEGTITVPDVTPQEILSYEIRVETPLSFSQAQEISEQHSKPLELVQSSYRHFEGGGMSLRVPSSGTAGVSAATAAATLPDYTVVRYMTFIPNTWVTAPPFDACSTSGTFRFLGDNRGFSPTASSFRTRFDVRVNWLNNTAISPTRTVGTTIRQKFNDSTKKWESAGSDIASIETMTLTLSGPQTSNHATFNIHQDVVNPFCTSAPTNGIFADFDLSIWRAGSYSYSGTALLAPNHELYIKDQDKTYWDSLFTSETKNMDCLIPFWSTLIGCLDDRSGQGVR